MRWRLLGLIGGPAAFALILAVPLPGLSRAAHVLAAVLVWAVVYWVTEILPPAATALLSSAVLIVLGVAPARQVLAPYADPVVFLFLGTFILAEGARASSLDRRIAYLLLSRRWATRGPGWVLAAVGLVTWILSLWMSNTATTALMLPVGVGLTRIFGERGAEKRFSIGLLLMLTWASSVAVGLPIASPPNLIAIGLLADLAAVRLSFASWVLLTMPLAVVMLVLCWTLLYGRYRPKAIQTGDVRRFVEDQLRGLGPVSRKERYVLGALTAAAVLWMAPGTASLLLGPDAGVTTFLEAHLPESAVALAAAIALLAVPLNVRTLQPVLTWRDAAGIDWGTIFLFGGGLALGTLTFQTGLAATVAQAVVRATGSASVWALTALAIALGIILSETTSNTASAGVVVPSMIALAAAAGVSPIPPAVGAALGASFGFMLPVSTPPNAIVYGTGLIPLRAMISSGLWLDLAGGVVIWIGLRLLCPVLGLV